METKRTLSLFEEMTEAASALVCAIEAYADVAPEECGTWHSLLERFREGISRLPAKKD